MKYVLGVDAGNSKTIALIAGHNGRIVGTGRGGCGDIYGSQGAGGEAAIQSIVHKVYLSPSLSSLSSTGKVT
jgi:N-acetylglucosamine kinase-like BadF-type ATPase